MTALMGVTVCLSAAGCSGHHAAASTLRLSGPFQTPGGRVVCDIEASNASCELHTPTAWTVPAKPKDCNFDWLGGVDLTEPGPAHFGCWSGAPGLGASSIPTVSAGRVVVNGRIRCAILSNGVRCDDSRSRHGFVYTSAAYRLF